MRVISLKILVLPFLAGWSPENWVVSARTRAHNPIFGNIPGGNGRAIILRKFWEKHPDARQPLQTWYADVKLANWTGPADIKGVYQNASFLAKNRATNSSRSGNGVAA